MIELMGLIVTGGGLAVSALSLFGVFSNRGKIAFFEKIFKTQDAIPRGGQIFEEFIEAFPPSVNAAIVTKIMPRRMDMSNDGRDCFSSVFYEENGLPGGQAVATESEVKAWAYKTSATATGIVIASIGLIIQIIQFVMNNNS